MPDIDDLVQVGYLFNSLREPVFRSAIQALQLPAGSRGLDAGCGIGLQALLLAETVGPAGHITGLDLSSEILVHAKDVVKKAGLSERISFREGDVNELPFDDAEFDWAWSVDCVGYMPVEPLPVVKELARVVKPGGSVAILAWSSEKLLPGYPVLEARLSATTAGVAPFVKGKKPESHFLRGLGWFRDAGLEESRARTFAGDTYAPLTDDDRSALTALFEMRWPGVQSELRQEDVDGNDPWAEYRRLCLPESPDFILDHPDYYAFFTYSMFHGKVVE
jgi:SAM-dependent methyltransferase